MKLAIFTFFLAAKLAAQPACPGFTNCLYPEGQRYEFSAQIVDITYTDVTGRPRTVEVTVRVPSARTGSLPVMIWAHGGGEGRNTEGASRGALSYWSETSAEWGFLTVSPAFHARNQEDQAALCIFLGVEPECDANSTQFDRPYDIKAILDFLEAQNKTGPLTGRIDMSRVGVGGHSAGSSGSLSVAGAVRDIEGKRYGADYFGDPRPRAFVALSPSAPGSSAMFDSSFNDPSTSWDDIPRPVIFFTGLGDGHEQFPQGRRIPYDKITPGDKYRLWVKDNDFGHGMYGDDLGT
ncbi:MAG: hypothetical protein HY820_36805, partial [Acidobacteria bacterium]|nr:hypothetical protein [Acidobacteriota bacterium]